MIYKYKNHCYLNLITCSYLHVYSMPTWANMTCRETLLQSIVSQPLQ